MSTFRTEQDLRHALSEAGLDALADRIVATMRPAIQFVRRQQPDDALPPGTSKIGGLPDLPPGFAWPHRQSPADADTRIRALREQRIRHRERSASSRSQRPSDDILVLLSEHERDAWLRSIEASRPDPDKLRAIHAQEDRYDDLMAVALGREFPLAFLAQINLGALSNESGFDRDLPRRGVLSLFEDLTDDRIRHLFSWGGEYYAGTRRMHAPSGGDGTTYLMIQRDDLLSHRFDKAQSLYQCD